MRVIIRALEILKPFFVRPFWPVPVGETCRTKQNRDCWRQKRRPSGTRKAAKIEVQTAGRATGRQIHVFGAHTAHEIDAAFEAIAREQAGALLVLSDPFFTSSVTQITTLGTRAAIPAVYPSREYAEAGGILSYGADVTDEYRKAGVYVGRILRGAKPADLPVLQPTKFELIVNLKTAKSLGLKIADSFLLLADEVIE